MKNTMLLVLFIGISSTLFAQDSLLSNEELIIEFETIREKKLVVAIDKKEAYMVCRLWNENELEMHFPDNLSDTWKEFSYSYYDRGGGKENAAQNLNFLYFVQDGYQYVIYENYFSETDKTEVGIKVIDLSTKVSKNYTALPGTVKGSLQPLRENKKIQEGDTLF